MSGWGGWLNNNGFFQPPKEADNAASDSVTVNASKDLENRVPSKLIIPDIFCGSTKTNGNGHLPQNGSSRGLWSSSSSSSLDDLLYFRSRSSRGDSSLHVEPHFHERRHSESVVKSRNSQPGAYSLVLAPPWKHHCVHYYTHSVVAK